MGGSRPPIVLFCQLPAPTIQWNISNQEPNSSLDHSPFILVEFLSNMVANFQECVLERTQKESCQFLDLALRTGKATLLEGSISQAFTMTNDKKDIKFTSWLDQCKTFGTIFTSVLNTFQLIFFVIVIIVYVIRMSGLIYMSIWKPEVYVRYISLLFLTLFFNQGFSQCLELTELASQQTPRIHLSSPPPVPWLHAEFHSTWLLCGCRESELRPSCLCLNQQSHLSSTFNKYSNTTMEKM